MANELKGISCKHVVYCKPNPKKGQDDDYHFVKETLVFSDGTTKPNIRILKNFKRDFYITKKGHQTFKDKKEYIELEKVNRFESSQSKLVTNIFNALGKPFEFGGLRMACRSPYVYGADILSTAVIKKQYQDKYPEINVPNSVAVFDTETDMVYGTGQIIMSTLSFKDKVFTVIRKDFLKGHSDIMNRLQKLLIKYLGEHIEKRNIKWEVILVDHEYETVTKIFEKAHEWKPDIVAIWNMKFDIDKSKEALYRAGIDPADVFSDPSVPKEYKSFYFNPGKAIKVMASGTTMSRNWYELWPIVTTPSSFYLIDAACLYYQIRSQGAKEQSYALNAILDKHLGIRKLNFKEAEHLDKGEWHQFMQSNYPLEYVIYNVFDCISMELLDEVTNDMALMMSTYAGYSDYKNINSQPTLLADKFHYYVFENGYVYGTTSDEMANEFDELTTSGKGWISALPAELIELNGLKIIEEDPNLSSNLRLAVGDLDVKAAYPHGGIVFNISRSTTHKELIKIENVSEEERRRQGLNLSAGPTNAVEVVTGLFGLPDMNTLLKAFQNQ